MQTLAGWWLVAGGWRLAAGGCLAFRSGPAPLLFRCAVYYKDAYYAK